MGPPLRDLDSRTRTFYDAPNEIDVDSLQGTPGELIRMLLSRLGEGRRTLLPARVNGETRWYGFAGSDRDGRLLAEELASWLGPPLCDEASVVDKPEDVVEERAALLAGDGTLLRTCVAEGWQREARENVRCLVDIWALAPERASDAPRPVGRVLRHFYEGIAARDLAVATDAIEEIRAGGLLSAANIRFLRVELLGRLGSPEELRSDPLLTDIALLRRPPAVTDHLARAADALYIPPTAVESGPDIWRSIAVEIEEVWPGLLAHPSQVRSVYGARCLALTELRAEHPRHEVADSLRSEWNGDALVAAVVAALESVPVRPLVEVGTVDGASVVLHHHRQGKFEAVLDAAERTEPDSGTASAVMHAALNLGDAAAATRSLAIVDRLSDVDRTALLSQAVESAFYTQLVERNQGTRIPEGWIDWLRGEWPDRPDLLDDWSSDWRRDALAAGATADAIAEELLDALHDDRRGRVRNGLPALVHWLGAEDGLGPSSIPLAVTIFDIMLGSDPGRPERSAALVLLGEILLTGCSAVEYRTAVVALRDQLRRIGPREVDWLTGMLDVLLLSAVPSARLRDEIFVEALGVARSWFERVQQTDAILLRKLFADAGLEFDPPMPDRTDAPVPRKFRTFECVAIYSLSESAAQNAARWIRDEWPNVDVRLSHTHANSPELESLVRASDVVLVQTSHAKHAATIAIERLIGAKRLVRVNGRGATSIFRGLLEWATSDN
ncbi:protein DpdD [Candidatus Poriferisodalis sp.]|uniref:protein DpdD n=1 Tax=Candidatus Poriferisodalis sp. TaxID=3101277 RepID=UPI003B029272